MAGPPLHRFYAMRPQIMSPQMFLCNGQHHELHTKFRFSNCNFLTRCGLHEIYVMSRKLIPQDFSMYVMFLSCGVVFSDRGQLSQAIPKFSGNECCMNERQLLDSNRGTTNAKSMRTNFCGFEGKMTANERSDSNRGDTSR